MKMNVPDEYVPLIVKGLEHYYAYTRAVQRDDSRYQKRRMLNRARVATRAGGNAAPLDGRRLCVIR
jgi:hypothetical protein